MGIKGCWTCRERKVKCDLHWPSCGNCTKARRVCQGYGIQLSWPRDGDRKRAIILRDKRHAVRNIQSQVKRFLNASSWDVSLAEEIENGRVPARYLRTMKVPRPTYLSPTGINGEALHLLGFFNESRSLMLGPTDEEVLAQFILRIAFSDPSDTTNPVLQGVLALASQQLHGSSKSFRYKHLVVSSVRQSINCLDEKVLLQNLMATMLLYHYELSLESNSKGSWVIYLCAVKNIINTSLAMQKLVRQEYSVFLDWIYYHEVLAEFTVRHWKVPYEGCGFVPWARAPRAIEDSPGLKVDENNIGCPTDVLQLVVHTCRRAIVLPPSTSPLYDPNPYPSTDPPTILEQNISKSLGDYGPLHIQSSSPTTPVPSRTNIEEDISDTLDDYTPLPIPSPTPSNPPPPTRNTLFSTLHRVSALLYANRATHNLSGTEFRHRRLVKEGISLLTQLKTCQSAWPLFIIGCEAVDDEQRLAVLDVFERTVEEGRRKKGRSGHVAVIRALVEGVWVQVDLSREREGKGEGGFMAILDAVVGGCPFIPPFA